MELDLPVDNIVNELALDNEFGSEVFEPPDLFGINDRCGFDIGGDVFEVVLALAPVPDPVFGKGPGIYFEEKFVQICHIIVLETVTIYIFISFLPYKFLMCSYANTIYRVLIMLRFLELSPVPLTSLFDTFQSVGHHVQPVYECLAHMRETTGIISRTAHPGVPPNHTEGGSHRVLLT